MQRAALVKRHDFGAFGHGLENFLGLGGLEPVDVGVLAAMRHRQFHQHQPGFVGQPFGVVGVGGLHPVGHALTDGDQVNPHD